MKYHYYTFVAILLVALTGCGGARQPSPTVVPATEPTITEESPTEAPAPTNTIEPTIAEPTIAATQGPRTTDPAGAAPADKDNCPDDYPIKGNIRDDGEKLYHEPGFRSYGATDPEICFALVQDAVDAGFSRPENT